MRGWGKLVWAVALLAAATPVFAQGLGGNASEGETFLKAVEEGDGAKAVPMLENAGSRVVNYRGYDGETGLIIATRKRDSSWVGYLLRMGADPNIGDKKGETPLIIASRLGFDDAIGWMLGVGAKVDQPNRVGETALIVAVQQRQPRIVELLLRAGANPDKADHAAGYSARDYAKRDGRTPQLIKLIETVKPKPKGAGPSL